jgi:hypothetical protein
MSADWYLKNTLQLKFWNNFKLTNIPEEILKISVKAKYCNAVDELVSEFLLPKLGGTYRIINNVSWLLQANNTLLWGKWLLSY